MNLLKNILAGIGVLALILFVFLSVKVYGVYQSMEEFDPEAKEFYKNFASKILQSHSGVDALVKKVPVAEGLKPEDVDEAIRYVANELNIKNVGELYLYKEIESLSGTPFRYIKIYLLCNAMTAASMMNYNDAFSSYLPCRVTLLEDKTGKLWLYTMDMDLMIKGGRALPPALKAEASKVRNTIMQIMDRASRGDF